MEKKFHRKPNLYTTELSLNVTDLDRSIAYYEQIIGFRVLEKQERKAVLTADGKTPMLTLEQPEGVLPKEGRRTGMYHFALLLPSRADLAAFLRHIAKNRVRLGAADHHVSEAIYLADPDGNEIEVYRDRPSAEWIWKDSEVHMVTEPLDAEGILAESGAEWKGLPEETIIGHMHLHVADLAEAEKFYCEGLGFTVVCHFPGALFVSTGGYHHHIGLNIWNGVGAPPKSPNSAGMNWFTVVYPDEEARRQTLERLKVFGAEGIAVGEDVMVEDPSGIRILLRV